MKTRQEYLMQQIEIERAIRALLEAIGEDPEREGLRETPRRVAKMYLDELAIGTQRNLVNELSTTFEEAHKEMVLVRDIPFYSLCEHHMVPYIGTADIGYIPNGRVIGLSKLARVVDVASRRLTIQERLCSEIADAIETALSPTGVMVVMSAEHLCMAMRGIKKPGTSTVTSAVRGIFDTDLAAREEFLRLRGSK